MQYLSNDFAVSPQINLEDVNDLKDKRFSSIFCHRPDGEDAEQPNFVDVKDRGQSVELEVYHLPVLPGQIAPSDVTAFRELYQTAPKPILAFCKSGARAKSLWDMMHDQNSTVG